MLAVVVMLAPSPKEESVVQRGMSKIALPRMPSLLERVATALACPAPRADIQDILAGAPYEFKRHLLADSESKAFFDKLPQLVARVTKEKDLVGATRAETELQETVLQLAATGGGWPAAIRQRLLQALDGPCSVNCSAFSEPVLPTAVAGRMLTPAKAVPLEVDAAHTSPGTVSASSGWLHRTVLNMGAATGIPVFGKRASLFKSRPATVVVSSDPIVPRDCFALRGKSSVALRVATASGSAVVQQIVIEQLPHWIAPKLWSLPGRFDVWGEPAASIGNPSQHSHAPDSQHLRVHLGSFEYVAAAPAPQAFKLKNPVAVRALQFSFQETSADSSASFFCIYRVRAYDTQTPSCATATSNSPARLVFPS